MPFLPTVFYLVVISIFKTADFCAENNIVIGGSQFPHKQEHRVTWVSPDQVMENQIDHIGISRKFRRSMLGVRAKRGVDAASDHHLTKKNEIQAQKVQNINQRRDQI